MDYTEIKAKLKDMITEKRYEHSIGVSEFAKKVALTYNYNTEKAYISGLLHDCARDMKIEELKRYASMCNIEIGEIESIHPVLLHAPVGACIAQREFGIDDRAILRAISSHTILNETPTLLDKIIYVSDLAEPGRRFEEAEKLRDIVFKNIDEAVIYAIDISFEYLIHERRMIHPVSLAARNLLIKEVYYDKN